MFILDPETSSLDRHQADMHTQLLQKTYTAMFLAALFEKLQMKQLKCSSTVDSINELWC